MDGCGPANCSGDGQLRPEAADDSRSSRVYPQGAPGRGALCRLVSVGTLENMTRRHKGSGGWSL